MPVPTFLANHVATAGVGPAVQALTAGRPLLDVIEAAIRPVEDDPAVDSVGYGGLPNMLGELECDAAIMLGATRQTGAVGALRGYRYPITVARQVLELTPHVFLVGAGAERFAAEIGAEPRDMLAGTARAEHAAWLGRHGLSAGPGGGLDGPLAELAWRAADDLHARGTTVVLVADAEGRLAGGTSTSGWAFKYPGRLGDSPVIGAGLYVDDRYGAAACTHNGEMAIRAGTARAVVAFLQQGATVIEACRAALDDLAELRGGYLGPVIVHALDPRGNACVLGGTPNSGHWIWDASMPAPELRMVGAEAGTDPANGSAIRTSG